MAFIPPDANSLTVSLIKQLNFSQLPLQEKIAIKLIGRPTPNIPIIQSGINDNKKFIRSFNSEWYQKRSWLSGCEVRRALFCFPCLLFGGHATWTEEGFTNIYKFKEKCEKHEKSKKHIENTISLSLLGSENNKEKLSESVVTEHNSKVTKNREVLSKIIDCLILCGNFETSLREYNEYDPKSPSAFRALIAFASKLDPLLNYHLKNNPAFTGDSRIIQNEILDCLVRIYHTEIKKEIKDATFVAFIADDMSDVCEFSQTAIILRYVLNSNIYERFWGFFNPENQDASCISKCILEQLDIVLQGDRQKLIAQAFDSLNVINGKKSDVQSKIKEHYNNANVIHCYTNQLNQIMRSTASVTRSSKIFYSNFSAIARFFSKSVQSVCVLNKHIKGRPMQLSSAMWNCNIWTLNKIYEQFGAFKSCLIEIQSNSNTDETISEAIAILNFLNSAEFTFWLEIFHQIMPHVKLIYQKMQCSDVDVSKVYKYITEFRTGILEIRNSKHCDSPLEWLMIDAKQVCDCLYDDIVERYSFSQHIVAAKLFNKKSLPTYKNVLPKEMIALTTEAYSTIDNDKFENELKVFYHRPDMHEYYELIDLLKFILENKLDEVLSETAKLLKILLTTPMTTSEPGRCFSTLERIKSFLRNTKNSERINALAIISIENHFLTTNPNIKENIIEVFAQSKIRKSDFSFK